MTHDHPSTLLPRDQESRELPLKLHSVFLDAQSGSIQATRIWSTPHPRVDVIPAREGRFVVLLPGKLTLYSRRLDPLKELDIPVPYVAADLGRVDASPQGASAVLEYLQGDGPFYWIKTDTLEVLRSWKEPLGCFSVSDREIAICHEDLAQGRFVSEINLRNYAGGERLVCRDTGDCGGPVQFVSDDILALIRLHDFILIGTDGGRLFAENFPGEDWLDWHRIAVSADGRRVALTVWAQKGGNAFLDIDPRIVLKRITVFDIPSRSWTSTLDVRKLKLDSKDLLAIALSPDGSLLALMDSIGIVQAYRLPEVEGPK